MHHSIDIIIRHIQLTHISFSKIPPQVCCIQWGAVSAKERCFDIDRAHVKPSNQHIALNIKLAALS